MCVVCLCVLTAGNQWRHLFLGWQLRVASESSSLPLPPLSSSSPPLLGQGTLQRPYKLYEQLVTSSLRFLANHTNSLCSWMVGCSLKKEGLVIGKRERQQEEKRTKGKKNSSPGCLEEKEQPITLGLWGMARFRAKPLGL